jgi:hypothetical protein
MKLKLDENLSRHLKHVLIELNLDVMTAAEQGLLSKSDKVIADQDSLASFEGLRRGASARQVADVARHEVPRQSPSSEQSSSPLWQKGGQGGFDHAQRVHKKH